MMKSISNSEINRFRQAITETENAKKERDNFNSEYFQAKVAYEMAKRNLNDWARHGSYLMTHEEAEDAARTASEVFRKATNKRRDLKNEANRKRNNLKARIKRAKNDWDDESWDNNIDLIQRANRAVSMISY